MSSSKLVESILRSVFSKGNVLCWLGEDIWPKISLKNGWKCMRCDDVKINYLSFDDILKYKCINNLQISKSKSKKSSEQKLQTSFQNNVNCKIISFSKWCHSVKHCCKMIPHHIATSIVLYEPAYGNLDLREVIFQLLCC